MSCKVGLATCFIDNYGACLQAYALQQTIESYGYECDIINYIEPVGYSKDNWFMSKIIKTPVYYHIRGIIQKQYLDFYKYNYKRHKNFEKFRKENLHFSQEVYKTTEEIMNHPPKYKVCVCGSDQIWNPTFYDMNNLVYHLDFSPAGTRRIAYAPSIGLDVFPEQYKSDFTRLIEKYNSLSVREQRGAEIVEEISGRDCRVVLDPTLLLPGSEWKKKLNIETKNEKYIFLYLFGEQDYIGDFVTYVKDKTGLKVVCIPFCEREKQNEEYIQINNAGPKEFVQLINNASLIITDSFHATAFSINLNKPFYSLFRNKAGDTKGMNSRITSILNLTCLNNRLIQSKEDFPETIDFNVNFSECNQILKEKRKEDRKFLQDSITGERNDT